MTKVKKLYRKNKNGKYVFRGHVPDNYPLDENEKFEDRRGVKNGKEKNATIR
jgi:hypothetical protein